MNYEIYKKNIYLILISYVVIFFSNILGEAASPFILTISYFGYRILSLYLLFFSIYAYIVGIKGTRKLEAPIIFIIIGALLVLLSFGPPIVRYFIMPETVPEVFSCAELAEMREKTKDKNIAAGRKHDLARTYYLYTGESISYLNDSSQITVYVPDEKTKDLKEQITRNREQRQLIRLDGKIVVLSLIAIFIISITGFLVFLRYKLGRKHKGL